MAHDGELYVNALADMIPVLDLRLGQRSAAGNAPIHRLFPSINEPLLHDVREQPQLIGLIGFVER